MSSYTCYTSTRPVPKIEPKWFNTFTQQLAQTQAIATYRGEVDLLLLGDSITEGIIWSADYQKHVPGLKILYYGIGGDKTENVLWRIEHGILDGIKPRFATLLIGVNNFWPDTPADEVAAGAIACGQAMRKKLPDTKLLHFGVFPLGAHVLSQNAKVDQINAQIQAAAAGYDATYVSVRDAFLEPDGKEKPGMLALDGVHLNSKGYDAWGEKVKWLVLDGR